MQGMIVAVKAIPKTKVELNRPLLLELKRVNFLCQLNDEGEGLFTQKKFLVHSPKKSEKSEKNPKNSKNFWRNILSNSCV